MSVHDRPSKDSEWQIFGDSGLENDSHVVATTPDGAIAESIYCLQCGYNLRGLSGDPVRCPECGEKNSLGSAAIPARQIELAMRCMETTPTLCVAFSLPTGLFLALSFLGFEQVGICLSAGAVCMFVWWWLCRRTRTEFDGKPGWRKILISFHVAAAFSIFETWALANAVATQGRDPNATGIYLALPLIGIPLLIWGWQLYRRARDELRSMQRDRAVRIARQMMYGALRRSPRHE